MSAVEGYELHVYCDDPEHEHYGHYYKINVYAGATKSAAYKDAREAGWKFYNKPGLKEGGRFAICAECRERP